MKKCRFLVNCNCTHGDKAPNPQSLCGEFPDVAKSVGEARPLGVAKHTAATASELTESSGEFPDVAKSVGEARPLGFAKYRAATRSELAVEFAKYITSVSTPGLPELIITARNAFPHSGRINF